MKRIHLLVRAVESAGIDIAPTYEQYMNMAFALANDLGEEGRSYFHRLCALHPGYDAADAEKKYTHALASHNGSLHIGTLFRLAEQAGVRLEKEASGGTIGTGGTAAAHLTRTRVHNNAEGNEESPIRHCLTATVGPEEPCDEEPLTEGSAPRTPLPRLCPCHLFPEPLQQLLQLADTPAKRDILFLGIVTVLGSTMGKQLRVRYSRKFYYSCLQTFIVAPPASGKGILSSVRLLAEPLHRQIRQEVEKQQESYRNEKAAYDYAGKERAKMKPPREPANKMFLITGNNTGTGLLQNLIDSGGHGLICEAEADTVSTAIGSDYGHWSDTLRKCFDHERQAFNRRTNEEYREITATYLSVLLSGTPAQVKPLIPSAENGLFSRQLFYYMPAIRHWVSQFDDDEQEDLDSLFRRLGHEWMKVLERYAAVSYITLVLSKEQRRAFDARFSGLFNRGQFTMGNEMSASVARLGVNLCRLMSVVAFLRAQEEPDLLRPDRSVPGDNVKDGIITRLNLAMRDDDFHALLSMAEPLFRHAGHILSFLPCTEVSSAGHSDRDRLFASLPDIFTRQQLLKTAEAMHIKNTTAETWLKRLIKRGVLRRISEATYLIIRAHTCEESDGCPPCPNCPDN